MTSKLPSAAHLDAGTLLSLLDGDADAGELARWRQHVNGCAECHSALSRQEQRSLRLSEMLREVELPADFAYPAEPGLSRANMGGGAGAAAWWLRAAAVSLLLLLPLLTVTPLRAAVTGWLAERWSDVRELVRTGGSDPTAGSAAAERPAGPALWFVPAQADLRVEFAVRQLSGSLTVRRSGGGEVSLQVIEGVGVDDITVSEQGVIIRNGPEATASISLEVPDGVRRVTIQIGAEPVIEVDGEVLERGRAIGLGDRR